MRPKSSVYLTCKHFCFVVADFSIHVMGCGDLLEVKPCVGVSDEKIEEIATPCMAKQNKFQPI